MPTTVAEKLTQEEYEFVRIRSKELGYASMSGYVKALIRRDREQYLGKTGQTGQTPAAAEPKTAEEMVDELVEEIGDVYTQNKSKMSAMKQFHVEISRENGKQTFAQSELELPTLRKLLMEKVREYNGHVTMKRGKEVSVRRADVETYIHLQELMLRKNALLKQQQENAPQQDRVEAAPLVQ